MKPTFKQLQEAVRGAAASEVRDGWLICKRFTDAQTEMYRTDATSTDFADKTYATAGVRLAFYTSSRSLSFDWRVRKASAYTFAWFDLYEDGVLLSHFGTEASGAREGHAELLLRPGETLVELYMPWSCAAELTVPELEDGASFVPAVRGGYTLFFGDSITHGYNTEFPSLTYPERFAREMRCELVNKGIGGEHFRPGLAALPEPTRPERIVVAYGTNDWNFHSREVLMRDFRAFVGELICLYPTVPIYAVTPIWRADGEKETPYGAPVAEVHDAMVEAVRDLPQVHPVRGWELTPHGREYLSDFVHPNTEGFAAYAAGLVRAVKAIEQTETN